MGNKHDAAIVSCRIGCPSLTLPRPSKTARQESRDPPGVMRPFPRRPAKTPREQFLTELEPHLNGLYRTALKLTGNPTDAEDVFQEAVLRAYQFFNTFRPGTNFPAWMHRVLYTTFVNVNRRDESPMIFQLETIPEPKQPESLQVAQSHPTHKERQKAVLEAADERIKEAVMTLPQDLRLVFMLNTIEGLNYREIADVMGCPVGTVMSRLFRSRAMLQKRLVDYAIELGINSRSPSVGVA